MEVESWAAAAAVGIEGLGVLVIVAGVLWSSVVVAARMWQQSVRSPFRLYRRYIGRSILLGLEFLVASDIIRTVSHTPSVVDVAVLGIIVVIRTFLSFALSAELEGRWPWKRHEATRL